MVKILDGDAHTKLAMTSCGWIVILERAIYVYIRSNIRDHILSLLWSYGFYIGLKGAVSIHYNLYTDCLAIYFRISNNPDGSIFSYCRFSFLTKFDEIGQVLRIYAKNPP